MEGEPQFRKKSLDKATLEATVRIPQVGFGIRLQAAEHCVTSEDPRAVIAELLAPLPLDEKLTSRTQKANAQHAYYGIDRVVKEEEVRRVQAAGNLQTLTLIGETLGLTAPSRQLITFDVDGTWSDPELNSYLESIQKALTPERTASLVKVMQAATEVLNDPATQQQLKERKEKYQGWGSMGSMEKSVATRKSASAATEVHHTIIDSMHVAKAATLSEEEKHMFTRAIFLLSQTII